MTIRSLVLAVCCLSCWGGSLSASAPDGDDYNSDSQAVKFCSISVSADPEEGANVSGGGKYTLNGNQVLISTNAMNTADYTYTFMYWTQNGVRTSYNQNFWFTPAEGTFDFVAHYEKKEVEFDPDNPQEPSSTSLFRRYFLYLTTNIAGACSFNMDSGIKVRVGAQLGISANLNPGYQFERWMQNGEIISTSTFLSYTMPDSEMTLEAVVSEIPYDPEIPQNPIGTSGNADNPTRQIIDLTIGDGDGYVDKTRIVINDTKSLDYELECDASKFLSNEVDYQIYSLDDNGTSYSINERPRDNGMIPIGIVVRNEGLVTIDVKRLECQAILVDHDTDTETDLAFSSYTFYSGTGTIEGRFSVKVSELSKQGDANGDGDVNYDDVTAIARYIMEGMYDGFFFENANMNGDQEVNAADIVLLISRLQ